MNFENIISPNAFVWTLPAFAVLLLIQQTRGERGECSLAAFAALLLTLQMSF